MRMVFLSLVLGFLFSQGNAGVIGADVRAPLVVARALDFETAGCVYSLDGVVVQRRELSLMALAIGDQAGRFVQVQFGDSQLVVQYQLLIEDDLQNVGSFVVLQNLLVGATESSAEFSARDLGFVRVAQGKHSVSCVPVLAKKKTVREILKGKNIFTGGR